MVSIMLAQMHFRFLTDLFDAILLSEVLEHLMYSPLPMFREIKRVLKARWAPFDQYP